LSIDEQQKRYQLTVSKWQRRLLGDDFGGTRIQTWCEFRVHINTTFVPVGSCRSLIIRSGWCDGRQC
jgi:hypothetical protein